MCLEKFTMLWRIKLPVMVILIYGICLGKLSYAEGAALKVSPSQTIVQHQISGLVGQKIRILLSSSELELRKDITLTTRTIPHTNEFAIGKGRFVTVNSSTTDHVARINSIMKNALSGLTRSDATDFVTDVSHAPLIKISLPKRNEAEVGKPYRLNIVTLPDPNGNQVVIKSKQPLPNGITLGKTRKNASGNWATELIWTPNPSEVGRHHLSILAKVPEVSNKVQPQSKYDMDIDVTDLNFNPTSDVKSLMIDQASYVWTEREGLLFKVSGHVSTKKSVIKLSPLTVNLFDSKFGTIFASDIPVDAKGHFKATFAPEANSHLPCLIQAESFKKVSSIKRVTDKPKDYGCYVVSPYFPATSLIKINFSLNVNDAAISSEEHPFLGPDPVTGEIDWKTINSQIAVTIGDSLGKPHILFLYIIKRSDINEFPAMWELYAFVDNKSIDGDIYGQSRPIQLGFDEQGKLICVALHCENTKDKSPTTKFDYADAFGGLDIAWGTDPLRLVIDFKNSTQTNSKFSVNYLDWR